MTDTELTVDEAEAIAVEAYLYLYPLVTMELTRRQLCLTGVGQTGRGPMGQLVHIRAFPTADFKSVVRPNFDTLYSTVWMDLAAEPMVISAPASEGRYYLLPLVDMWTDVFACPGSRTTGDGPLTVALCGPGWEGELPEGIERIEAPTPTVWMIGRTQTNGPADYPAVHAFQDQLAVTPLSAWGGPAPVPEPVVDPTVDPDAPPLDQVNAMSAAELFSLGAELMGTHPPHLTDWSQLARMRRIGIRAGQPYDAAAQPAAVQDALGGVPAKAQGVLLEQLPRLAPIVDGWMSVMDAMGVYGNLYAKRAIVAMIGLGANPAEDAVYPLLQVDADGERLDGSTPYVLHFDADALPPAEAFWSVTMYDAEGFQAANELDRFAIGDRDELTYGEDGSLDIVIQHENPGPDKVSNWLPVPLGPLGITMRIYQPAASVLHGTWTPPPVRKAV